MKAQSMKKSYLSLLLSVALAACSGDESSGTSSSGGVSNSGTASTGARIIENEDFTPGLKGIDTDNNGIRDDIDRLIAKKYSVTSELKKAAEQKARALQRFLEATDRTQALLATDGAMRAGACLYKSLPHSTSKEIEFREQVSKEIEALTANTKERFAKYWSSSNLVGGAVFEQPKEPVCG